MLIAYCGTDLANDFSDLLYHFPFKEEMPAELTVLLSTGGFIYLFIKKKKKLEPKNL